MPTFFPLLLLFLAIANIFLGKLLIKGERQRITDTELRTLYLWVYALIIIFYLVLLYVIDISNPKIHSLYFVLFLISILGFDAFMEWKYLKESKEYLVTLIVLILGLVIMVSYIVLSDRAQYTSLQELIIVETNHEEITRIKIRSFSNEDIDQAINITDQDTIEEILDSLSTIELQKGSISVSSKPTYWLTIYINSANDYDIRFYEKEDASYIKIRTPQQSSREYKVLTSKDHLETLNIYLLAD